MKQQFTIAPNARVTVNSAGVLIIDEKPAPANGRDYSHRPVQVAVRQDLSLELHGASFSATAALTDSDALSLITMLAYTLRERGFAVS